MVTYAMGPFFSNSTFMDDPRFSDASPVVASRSAAEGGPHEPRSGHHGAKLRAGEPPWYRRKAAVRGDIELFCRHHRKHTADALGYVLGRLLVEGFHVDDAGGDLVSLGELGQTVEIGHLAVGELEKEQRAVELPERGEEAAEVAPHVGTARVVP